MFNRDHVFKNISPYILDEGPYGDLKFKHRCFRGLSDTFAENMFDREVRYIHHNTPLLRIFELSIPQFEHYKHMSLEHKRKLWPIFMIHVYSILVGCLFDLNLCVPIGVKESNYCLFSVDLAWFFVKRVDCR